MRKTLAVVVLVSVVALAGLAGNASAQPVNQDGLVNVVIDDSLNDLFDVTIEDVNVAVAANLVVQACGIDVGPLALGVLGQAIAVDRSGRTRTICEVGSQTVSIEQN